MLKQKNQSSFYQQSNISVLLNGDNKMKKKSKKRLTSRSMNK